MLACWPRLFVCIPSSSPSPSGPRIMLPVVERVVGARTAGTVPQAMKGSQSIEIDHALEHVLLGLPKNNRNHVFNDTYVPVHWVVGEALPGRIFRILSSLKNHSVLQYKTYRSVRPRFREEKIFSFFFASVFFLRHLVRSDNTVTLRTWVSTGVAGI
jgi:hypothetical protein